MARAPRYAVLLVTLLVSSGVLAGCLSGAPLEAAAVRGASPGFGAVELIEEGGFRLDVPVEVYFFGFPVETVDAVRAKLAPIEVDHSASSSDRAFPPSTDTTPLGGQSFRAPAQPRAIFHVVDADATGDQAFLDAAAGWAVSEGPVGSLDANAAEDWLADRIEALRGRPLDREAPVFVVLHGGDALGDHTWTYTFTHGTLEGIRIFGERLPLTIFDASGRADPFVVVPRRSPEALVFGTAFGFTQPAAYDRPVPASGDATVDALVQLTTDAVHWRFLKGPLYPISTKPCHHITLLLAVHSTALTETLPGWARAKDWIDVEGLQSAFTNLTGDEVTVEMKVYRLPQDEPALDALARGAGTLVGLDALRWYLDENFEKFVTPAEGCEEYLSLLLYGDAAAYTVTGGIGVYDVQRGHRLSFSFVPESKRIRELYEGPGASAVNDRNATRERWNWATMLYAHETGHIFGQQHPQHIQRTKEGLGTKHSFEAIQSVMGYQRTTAPSTSAPSTMPRGRWAARGTRSQRLRPSASRGRPTSKPPSATSRWATGSRRSRRSNPTSRGMMRKPQPRSTSSGPTRTTGRERRRRDNLQVGGDPTSGTPPGQRAPRVESLKRRAASSNRDGPAPP